MSFPPRLLPLFRLLVALWAGLMLNVAVAAAGQPFDAAAFEAAKKAGRPILVAVHADWCGTCRAQEPVIETLMRDPKNARFTVFRVDFDKQRDVVRQLGVQWQSTLIVFKGGREVSRSTAVTEQTAIAAQLARAL